MYLHMFCNYTITSGRNESNVYNMTNKVELLHFIVYVEVISIFRLFKVIQCRENHLFPYHSV
jgi:hypothetical protein